MTTNHTGIPIIKPNQTYMNVGINQNVETEQNNVGGDNQKPISCFIDYFTGPYMDCNTSIPPEKREQAYRAFKNITGYEALNMQKILDQLTTSQQNVLAISVFYTFIPILILIILVIWLMVGFKIFNWEIGVYLSFLSFIILYGFSIGYRMHGQDLIVRKNQTAQQDIIDAQQNFENSIAYWPQGFAGIACAVSETGTTGCSWQCNGGCPPCEPRTHTQNVNIKNRNRNRSIRVNNNNK